MTDRVNASTIVLVPGHWLGAWAWDQVVEHLRTAGHRTAALTLPGLDPQDPQRTTRTLDDQVATVEEALRRATGTDGRRPVLVAHSGANGPVSIVLDRHPELVGRVVWVDSGPATPGSAVAPDAPQDLVELPLPDFEALGAEASLEGLDADTLARFRGRAVPEPGPVLRQMVELSDPRRAAVPTTLVCCSLPSDQIMELARAGHPMFAEVAALEHIDVVDLPTGHWPMWSRPDALADVIAAAASADR